MLRKSAEVCAEIGYHVVGAEQEIKRIEPRLRADASVVASGDAAERMPQPTSKRGRRRFGRPSVGGPQKPRAALASGTSTMLKPNSGQEATGRDLHQILGDLDDSTVLAILALHPTVAELEEVRVRLDGGDDALGQRSLGGVVAEVFDMLKVDEEEPPPSAGR